MKKITITIAICIQLVSAQAPIYLNIGSHNETNDPLLYQSVYGDYEAAKTLLLQIADSVRIHNAKWNMQVDANFIRGCIAHDTARTNTSNFLKWADSRSYIEVDPHNHFQPPFMNPYNPTDLNHLLVDSCLLGTDRTNLGGFIWRDFSAGECGPGAISENWSQYNTGNEAGNKFPLEQWRPRVIWGGGSPNHCDDSNTFGIWKPQSATTSGFYNHTSGNYETVIGSNCGTEYVIFDTTNVTNVINDVIDVINYAQVYGNASTDFYTLTVMFNFRDLQSAGMVSKIATFIRSMDTYVTQNKVIWATLTEKYDTWFTSHSSSESFIRQCDQTNIGLEPTNISDLISLYPNPASNDVFMKFPYSYKTINYKIIDGIGNIVDNAILENNHINISNLSKGVYFLHFNIDECIAIKKVIVM